MVSYQNACKMSFGESYRLVIVFCIFEIILFKEITSLENFSEAEASKPIKKRHAAQTSSIPRTEDWLQYPQEGNPKQLFLNKENSEQEISTGPNLVEAIDPNDPGIDVRKLQRLQIAKRRTKETLMLEHIVEDYNFVFGEDVVEWFHVWDSGKEYFVGRRERSFQIVRLEFMTYEVLYAVDVGLYISSMTVYSFWNKLLELQEGVLLVTSADRIFWYRYNPNTKLIELYWEWKTGQYITSLAYFTVDSMEYLAITTNQSSSSNNGFYDLNIYQFLLHTQEFWIVQRLSLRYPCMQVAIIDTGRDIVLAVPQQNKAAVYTFNPHVFSVQGDPSRPVDFKLLNNFASNGIKSIAAFKMGGCHYLALGGLQPQILSYQQGKFLPNTVFGETFGLVELFLPIPLRTYRDDLILLVQRRVDFGTHFVTILESLIWDGEWFEAIIPVPCQQGPHTVYGVSCMLDMHRDEGIKGAAVLQRDAQVAVLVPRHKAVSGLFALHTKMLTRNSEYKDLQEIYSFLKEWVQEEDELIAQAQEFLKAGGVGLGFEPNLSELDSLETPELLTWAEIGEVYINDYRWTTADLAADLDNLLLTIQQLGPELLAQRRREKRTTQTDELEFDTLQVDEVVTEELLLDVLNSEKFFIQDGALDFGGILNVGSLKVLPCSTSEQESLTLLNLNFDEINGVDWKEIERGLIFRNKPLTLDELIVKGKVVIEDELKVNSLNGLKFPDDYLWSSGRSMSMVQGVKTFLGTLAANNLDTEGTINGVNLFDAITLSEEQHWTGVPTFSKLEVLHLNGTIQGRSMDEDGKDNGEKEQEDGVESETEESEEDVTKKEDGQEEGTEEEVTEEEVTEQEETEEEVTEEEVTEKEENEKEKAEKEEDDKGESDTQKTLADSTFIQADCIFEHLEIHGTLLLTGEYDERANLLMDIVQRPESPEEQIHIESRKSFSSIEFPVDFRLQSEFVNDIPLDQFVTLNTEQQLDITTLNGYVYFNNLTMKQGGTFDGVNVAELQKNSLKIDEALMDPTTQLNFLQDPRIDTEFEVHHSLNGIIIATDCQTVYEDLIVKAVNGNVLQANLIEVVGDVEGTARLNGHQLNELLGSSLSASSTLEGLESGESEGNIYLNELTLHAGLTADNLQGIDSQYLLDFLEDLDDIPAMILAGKVEVDAVITGDIQVHKLNGEHFDEDVQMAAIWLNRSNYLSAELEFLQPLHLHADINCKGLLNGQNLPDLIDDMVFRNDTDGEQEQKSPYLIWATKQFMRDVHVSGNTKVDAINDLRFHRIATKRTEQRFNGTLRINGNLYVQSVTISGSSNEANSLGIIRDLVSYDERLSAFVLHGEVVFNTSMGLQDLTVQGDLNDFRNLSGFFQELVYKNNVCVLKEMKTFTGRVTIDGGMYVRTLNGYNALALLSNIVTINERGTREGQQMIKSPVRFTAPLSIHALTVQNDLKGSNINGCHLQAWLEDSIWLDRDQKITEVLQFASGALDGNALSVNFLNEIEMSQVITLHTPQQLNASFVIPHFYLDGLLNIEGLINDIDLQEEYENTMMNRGNQHISTPLTMQSCRVLRTLRTNAPVNHDKDLTQVATLYERGLEFRSPLFLHNISARRVYTNDLVSGIDLNQWYRSTLWLKKRPRQWITGNWSVRTLSIRSFPGRKNGVAYFPELLRSVRASEPVMTDPNAVKCQYPGKKLEDSKSTGVYFVEYLEESFEMRLPADESISRVLPLYSSEVDYVLLNTGCYSYIYEWNSSIGTFQALIGKFESGSIDQLLLLDENTRLYESPSFVLGFITNCANTRNHMNCSRNGLNSWTLNGIAVKHSKYWGNNYSGIYQKHPFSPIFQAKVKQENIIHEFSLVTENFTDTHRLSFENDEQMIELTDEHFDKLLDELQNRTSNMRNTVEKYPQGFKRIKGPIKKVKNKPRYKDVYDEYNGKFHTRASDQIRVAINSSPSEIKNPQIYVEKESNRDRYIHYAKYQRSLINLRRIFPSAVKTSPVSDKPPSQSEFLHKTVPTTPKPILSLADFEEIAELILHDLSQRLSLEINIIQLSIPESDLYDVHLMQDFIDIITQIQDSGRAPEANWEDVQLPSNPAQVLAGRSIMFIWQAMIEIEKEQYRVEGIRGTPPRVPPSGIAINRTLTLAIRDLLRLAYKPTKEDDGGIMAIIMRLHALQNAVAQIAKGINLEFKQELQRMQKSAAREDYFTESGIEMVPLPSAETVSIATAEVEKENEWHAVAEDRQHYITEKSMEVLPPPLGDTRDKMATVENKGESERKEGIEGGKNYFAKKSTEAKPRDLDKSLNATTTGPSGIHTTIDEEEKEKDEDSDIKENLASDETEQEKGKAHLHLLHEEGSRNKIILEVGSTAEPHYLSAIFQPQAHSLLGQQPGIMLLTYDKQRKLFQTVNAEKPHELTSIRIHDETLLAFVEDCCSVRVFIYRGVQGFIELAKIIQPQRVNNLSVIKLRESGRRSVQQRHFMAVNVAERVIFYEVVMAGNKVILPAERTTCQ